MSTKGVSRADFVMMNANVLGRRQDLEEVEPQIAGIIEEHKASQREDAIVTWIVGFLYVFWGLKYEGTLGVHLINWREKGELHLLPPLVIYVFHMPQRSLPPLFLPVN